MPPRMAAANSGSSRSKPISGRTWTVMPDKTPARAARPPPIIQAQRTTARTSMPVIRASAAFSAVPRIALPRKLRVRNRCSPITATRVRPSTKTWSGVIRIPPITLRGRIGSAIWMSRLK